MGNGRESGSSLARVRALGAGLALLVAGCLLLGSSFRHAGRDADALVRVSGFPLTAANQPSSNGKPNVQAVLGHLPLIFEPNLGQLNLGQSNLGQSNLGVKYLARGAGYSLSLDAAGAVLALPSARSSQPALVRMKLVGANPGAAIAGADPLPGKSNYLIGNDPRRWHRNVPQFAGVRYREIYPGIDLLFYGNQGHLEYDFKVGPGANPSSAELEFDGVTKLQLQHGDLILDRGDAGSVRLQAPRIYQDNAGSRQPVEGRFVLRAANRVGFEIGNYDRGRELVIDPQLDFSTYFGGSGSETYPSIAVDTAGNIYLASSTNSPTNSFPFPTVTQIGPGANVFVAKIDPTDPPSVSYLTFFGGTGADNSVGIGVDGAGNAYVVGNTTSSDFPTSATNVLGYQTVPETKGPQCASVTCTSVFVSVLNSTGAAFNYSSYLSGNGDDDATGMATDSKGNVFVTGTTTSNDTPTLQDLFPAAEAPPAAQTPFQSSPLAAVQFFVTKVNTLAAGIGSISYSTYFGGGSPANGVAVGGGIAVDISGIVYFTGTTNFISGTNSATDFPILNPYLPCLDQIPTTVITNPVTCANTTGTTATDAFVAKLNPNGPVGAQQLLFSTYLGGAGTDSGVAIALDPGALNIYVTGATNSEPFVSAIPTGTATFQLCLNVPPPNPTTCPAATTFTDAYVARFNNPAESSSTTTENVGLTYFSYVGGSANESGLAIAVDTASGALITGSTTSPNFPFTTGAIQSALLGPQNAFFARINTSTTSGETGVGSYATYFGGNGTDRGTGIALDSSSNTYFVGDTTSTNLQVANWLQNTLNGPSDDFIVKLGTAADLAITGELTLGAGQTTVSAGNQVTTTYTITNNGPDLATNVIVSGIIPSGTTFNSASAGSGTCSTAATDLTVACTIAALQSGSTVTVTIVLTPNASGFFTSSASVSSVTNNDPDPGNNTFSVSFEATDFAVTVSPSSQTVAAGNTAQYTVTVTPQQGVYGASITLACSANVPGGATCTLVPSTITLNSRSAQSSALELTTTARPVNTASITAGHAPLYAIWLIVPGIGLFAAGKGSRRRRRRVVGVLLLCALFALLAFLPACKSKATTTTVSGTPAGTYTLTLTGTSGTDTHNANFILQVE